MSRIPKKQCRWCNRSLSFSFLTLWVVRQARRETATRPTTRPSFCSVSRSHLVTCAHCACAVEALKNYLGDRRCHIETKPTRAFIIPSLWQQIKREHKFEERIGIWEGCHLAVWSDKWQQGVVGLEKDNVPLNHSEMLWIVRPSGHPRGRHLGGNKLHITNTYTATRTWCFLGVLRWYFTYVEKTSMFKCTQHKRYSPILTDF